MSSGNHHSFPSFSLSTYQVPDTMPSSGDAVWTGRHSHCPLGARERPSNKKAISIERDKDLSRGTHRKSTGNQEGNASWKKWYATETWRMTWMGEGGVGKGVPPRWRSECEGGQTEQCRFSSARAQSSRRGRDKQEPDHEAVVKNPGRTSKSPGFRSVFLKADPGGGPVKDGSLVVRWQWGWWKVGVFGRSEWWHALGVGVFSVGQRLSTGDKDCTGSQMKLGSEPALFLTPMWPSASINTCTSLCLLHKMGLYTHLLR